VHEQAGQRTDAGVLFLTMELVPGTSLGQRLRAEGRLSSEAALPIVQGMVAAIAAAHAAGIVHRDFKSDNVMLAPGEPGGPPRAVVMDFGLARATSLPTNTSSFDRSLAGTLAYMAPEQLEGKATGPATDTYALGIVMYEMLTGQLRSTANPAGRRLGA
jgi:serine/threonine protein kinase